MCAMIARDGRQRERAFLGRTVREYAVYERNLRFWITISPIVRLSPRFVRNVRKKRPYTFCLDSGNFDTLFFVRGVESGGLRHVVSRWR